MAKHSLLLAEDNLREESESCTKKTWFLYLNIKIDLFQLLISLQTTKKHLATSSRNTSNNYQMLVKYISQCVKTRVSSDHCNAAEMKVTVGVLTKMAWKSKEQWRLESQSVVSCHWCYKPKIVLSAMMDYYLGPDT